MGVISVPFHHNVNTPAASLFKDKDNVERLYCYSCKKQFTSYHYIVEVLEKEPIEYLLQSHSKEELDELLKDKMNFEEQKTKNLVFTDIETLLIDMYNYDMDIKPKIK